MEYFFTSDQHFGHDNIIKYCSRPFLSIEEMDACIIQRHNEIVKPGDVVIHAGDFTLKNRIAAQLYIKQLNGNQVFLKGSHDSWLPDSYSTRWERTIDGIHIVVDHYAMRVWPRSHYNSWMLYGHSHGRLEPIGKSWDIGVDNNNFYPVSFSSLKQIMVDRPDNFGLRQ